MTITPLALGSTIGASVGTDVQAYDADLDALAGLSAPATQVSSSSRASKLYMRGAFR